MPIARYFVFVGGVLLALLLLSDAVIPKLPVADRAVADLPAIRIHSDRKWPEAVVFDTTVPAVAPVQTATAQPEVPAASTAADISAKGRTRDAFAQLQASDPKPLESASPKKPDLKPQPKRKVARKHVAPPTELVAQQPQFGFFASNTW